MEYLLYVLAAGVAGSVTAFLKHGECGARNFVKRILDGCFSAYIVYEIAFFCAKDMRLSLAICGIGAFKGSGILDLAVGFIRNKFDLDDRNKDEQYEQ
uniref:Holin n=1 Tax=Siphoviridae sp. ctgFB34 TaxID=2823591 RepID=A0A8S5L7S6_9CAUD|nr:MAG TPA: holin [Siphoviridae sp. ctgFB34]